MVLNHLIEANIFDATARLAEYAIDDETPPLARQKWYNALKKSLAIASRVHNAIRVIQHINRGIAIAKIGLGYNTSKTAQFSSLMWRWVEAGMCSFYQINPKPLGRS